MKYFQNAQELIEVFGDIDSHSFYGLTNLTDTPVGFSVKKHYPRGLRFRPAVRQVDGMPDNIAAIWVVYLPPDGKSLQTRVPLRIRVALMSQYRANHWDYDYSDIAGGCPSKASVEASLSSPQPIELVFEREYLFDHAAGSFLKTDGSSIKGVEILETVMQHHCDTVHLFKGMKLRLKLAVRSGVLGVITILTQFFSSLLKHLFGRTLENSEMLAAVFSPYKKEAFKKLDQDSIDLIGYKASKHVIVLFCFVVFVLAVSSYNSWISNGYIIWLIDHESILAVHGLLVLWLLDVAIPWALFFCINALLRAKRALFLMSFSA